MREVKSEYFNPDSYLPAGLASPKLREGAVGKVGTKSERYFTDDSCFV